MHLDISKTLKLKLNFTVQQKLGMVPKEYAYAEGLLYRQKDKLLRLIVLLHINQFV